MTLYETAPQADSRGLVVFAVTGDMVLLPVFEAKDELEAAGYRVRIVCVVNPRRLFRPADVAWETRPSRITPSWTTTTSTPCSTATSCSPSAAAAPSPWSRCCCAPAPPRET